MVINNVCEGCGSELKYDAQSGELKCVRCGSIVDIPEIDIVLQKRQLTSTSSIKTSKTKYAQYHCSTCGRNHILSANNELISCPSCGDSNLTRTLNVEYMPDGIIPFKLNKDEALKCFKSWIKKCRFAPRKLAQRASECNFNGVYLPSYIYNFYCETNYSGVGVNKVTTHTVVNGVSTSHTSYTRKHFSGTREDSFLNYIHSANTEVSTEVLKKMGNYNFRNVCVYRPEFLYGWVGSEVNVPLERSVEMAKNDIRFNIQNKVKMENPYDSIENFVCNTSFVKSEFNYLYLPVWACNYKYKNKTYNFYINGVTGKTHGKSPKSRAKIALLSLFILGFVGVISYFLINMLLSM